MIGGGVRMLRYGGRWVDFLAAGVWERAPRALAAAGGPARATRWADTADGSDGIRRALLARGTVPVNPNTLARKHRFPFDRAAYRKRNLPERACCSLMDVQRITTPCHRGAGVFLITVTRAAIATSGSCRRRW